MKHNFFQQQRPRDNRRTLKNKNIDICAIQQTKKKDQRQFHSP